MIEKDRTAPGRETLKKLSEHFNVTIDYLLNDKEENNNKSKNEGLGGIFDLISGFDADKIQEGLNGMKKILAVLGELSKPEEQDLFDR